jgi:MoxR-like ATPase
MDYTDLKRRLVEVHGGETVLSPRIFAAIHQAAAAIAALEAERDALRVLLSNLADAFEYEASQGGDFPEQYAWPEYRAARAALADQPAEGEK